MVLELLGIHMQKNNNNFWFVICNVYKNQPKMGHCLKYMAINLLEESIKDHLCDFRLGKNFLVTHQKRIIHKIKN